MYPIYKKDNKHKCENYGRISLANMSKVFEHFLNYKDTIYYFQFGFHIGYCTNYALLRIIKDSQISR